ncbi:MAG: MmcQ/YjbR family DNA-binding protein [Acidobacteriaceae bacterium]
MFALLNLDDDGRAVLSFAAGPEGFAELVEREGIVPAPYMARIYWVALEHWNALRVPELEERLRQAHALTAAKLPRRTQDVLAMPPAQQRRLIVERKKLLASRPARPKVKKAKANQPDAPRD